MRENNGLMADTVFVSGRVIWLPLVDLFRNYGMRFNFNLSDVKPFFEILNVPNAITVV